MRSKRVIRRLGDWTPHDRRVRLDRLNAPVLSDAMAITPSDSSPAPPADWLTPDLDANIATLRDTLQKASDVVFRPLVVLGGKRACIVYVDGLSDMELVDAHVLESLIQAHSPAPDTPHPLAITHVEAAAEQVTTAGVKPVRTFSAAVESIIVELQVVLFLEGTETAIALNAGGGENRAISEPDAEAVVRGPREGFNESLRTSITLLRRRIRTPDLAIETMQLGTYTQTKVALCYIEGIADSEIVNEVRTRLKRIDTDSIIDTGYIEELIEDNPFSPFPQIQNTERPDVVASMLVEGRVAILADGSPFALIAPINFWGALQAAEDYYERFPIVNLIRWLRYLFMFIALYLPSLYVAITTFHQEMLPTKLLLSIAAAREVTPLPAIAECLLMEITFEALREAGIRLPKAVGSAISIVGALVIGQAAVEAGIVSAPMVIVVAITGIASFVIPRYSFTIAIRILRFGMIILGGTIGLFGIIAFTLAVIVHLASLRSIGVPYLMPASPLTKKNMRDVITRPPHWAMRWRPIETSKPNRQRQSNAMAPAQRMPRGKRRM
ncbi:putative membrane protein YfkQ [Alicyclobacillus hesperidum]|uniref:Membrane protein YfkQ n=1 Tax=Alicyclobacillus hesperidum TaxID=89784 RepID=A0A1H2UKQ7_9BACL|nr:spore germination protein [Alicyclobacillus hesperidum]GLV14383.1 putative membrane protein YfkQ [Alicyclobacillus hesperidum]SDW56753.1 spore germination protein KA [Alicyclobacillus hesperidum]